MPDVRDLQVKISYRIELKTLGDPDYIITLQEKELEEY